jgi:hypothetical protein
LEMARDLCATCDEASQRAIFGETGCRFYRIAGDISASEPSREVGQR